MLANLFMHYAFDIWLTRAYPGIQFERYADDAVVHCVSERQACEVLTALENRMEEVGLRLHPDKTRIVYVVHLPRFHVPSPQGTDQARGEVHQLPACDQQELPEEDQQRRRPDQLACFDGEVESFAHSRRADPPLPFHGFAARRSGQIEVATTLACVPGLFITSVRDPVQKASPLVASSRRCDGYRCRFRVRLVGGGQHGP
ncbi:reverse transcriptase domain-containing protein [Streptomyces sp. NPDC002659]|uniref:reverse transcriptase domain-containing protein n=1 Tax=Streptomyces sp. NPDC002659 TaxID=3364656 RepID=UPI0036A237C4